jgi:hypothetical protein
MKILRWNGKLEQYRNMPSYISYQYLFRVSYHSSTLIFSISGSHRDFDVWVVSSCQRSTTGLNYRNKLQICTMDTRYNISLFGKFVVVCESGLNFLSGDRASLSCSPAIPCQFPRQMAIDGPEWGKCLVNKASGRYSAGFRELNSFPHPPCSIFYFLSFVYC